jgi:hypothetical protein
MYFALTRPLLSSCSSESRVRSLSWFSFPLSADKVHAIDSPVDPDDTMLGHYLIATWAKVCQAMGPEFEPYLPVVMPPLLTAASAKADLSIYGKQYDIYSGKIRSYH